ncbi:hypothetical protein EIN_173790 [Entamoeba invadens IP1]|uniref:Peptidase S74 domain-containing protein n=1 Tax=Entamoeba invadens IP1 TaxID=370355 RepID=A0A0A1TW05_ENTIV|nr:hypothetical protein EIN_173790 [Entamoeba invadens IP1]ELP84704.1 hypothetical protein EIN_173790 [Entamoeba invadens IP1]|eukprot:XP_004184050.1 hypothetical protein EIN_173790 [Entamoeba invadens IP1]
MKLKKNMKSSKQWVCTFPGCSQTKMTRYNAASHVWDAHLRHVISVTSVGFQKAPSYKKLSDRKAVKSLVESYMSKVFEKSDEQNAPPNEVQMPPNFVQPNTANVAAISGGFDANEQSIFNSSNIINFNTVLNQPMPNSLLVNNYADMVQQNLEDSKHHFESIELNNEPKFVKVEMVNAVRRLCVFGEVLAESGYLQRSDARFKTAIEPIKNGLEKLIELVGVKYNYKGDKTTRVGFLAQDVEKVFPEIAPKGVMVDPAAILPVIVEALKEINEGVTDHTHNEELHTKISELISSIENLKIMEDAMTEQKTQKSRFEFSLGPAVLTGPLAVGFTAISIWVIFALPKLPGIWTVLFLASSCLWVSFWRKYKEVKTSIKNIKLYWTTVNTASLAFIGFITLISVALSLVIGTLGLFIGVFGFLSVGLFVGGSVLAPKRLGCTLEIITTIVIAFLVLLFLITGGMILTQPGFECTLHGIHGNFIEEIEVGKNMEQLLVNKLPWNCWSDGMTINGKLPEGISVGHDESSYIYGVVKHPFNESTVQVYVRCVDAINFFCASVKFVCKDCVNTTS